jgi:[ribosomal protein S18]-alanine N-acetyltransferase
VAVRMRPRFEIRRMHPDDLEEVMLIEREAFRHPWSPELFRRELEHDWSTILVALEPLNPYAFDSGYGGAPAKQAPATTGSRERIVAFLIYWLVHDEVHILNVAVAPEHRRKGLARMLMAETEKRAHVAKAALMTLEVRRSNQAALDLYREFDYRAVGVRPNYYVDEGEDAIVMVKELKHPG